MLARIWKSPLGRIFTIVLVSLLLVGFAFMDVPDWTDFEAVVGWLAFGGGAPIVIAYALSLIVENFPGWHNLPSGVKFILPMIASVGLSIGANYLLGFPEVVSGVSAIWFLVVSAVLAWLGSQYAYMKSRSAGYGAA
ncbi:unnamed protein product [marine sediment metagenome]|uniref:Uncharacterized protein n=1 Tax=marine sediment metagenome TaxID=412755 RepID=X0VYP2_9ZZZZ